MAETINFSYTEFSVSAEINLVSIPTEATIDTYRLVASAVAPDLVDLQTEATIDTYRLIASAVAPVLVDLPTEATIDTYRLIAEGILGYYFEDDIDDFRMRADATIDLYELPQGYLLTRLNIGNEWKLAAPYYNDGVNWKSVIESFINTFGSATWELLGDETWDTIGDETWGIERISWRKVIE